MIIYWSMIAVIALCAVGNYSTRPAINANSSIRQSKLWVYLPMMYIIFWTGIRTQFVDTAAYNRTYSDIPVTSFRAIIEYAKSYNKDQLFYFASGVFKYVFGDNYHFWLFAIALLCGLCVVQQKYRHSDMKRCYAMASGMVLPAYHEGMSNVLLEAAASGRPLITSDIPGCREAVEDGVSGYLCPAKDADALYEAMRRFVDLPESWRGEMGRRGRERMEQRFSKTAVVAETIKHLEI